MTWIVGTPTLFGYAILVSDIQVTFSTAAGQTRYLDCLQKIYPVSKSMLGGFAGSVNIGFRMLGQLQYESAKASDEEDWVLDIIANTWWPRIARRIFNKSEPEEQHLGSQLILGGAHPAKNMGDAPWPQTDVYTFSSPNFEPKKGGYRQILSIGAPDERYMKGVTKLVSNFAFLQSSIGGDFGPGSMLAHYLKSELEDAHLPGVSSLFQVGMASRRKVSINNFSEARFSADGDALQEDKFPPIACSYDEFVAICQSNGLGSSASLC